MADDLWTIEDVAAHLDVKPSSARGALSRMGVRAHSYRPHPVSHRAQALYDPEQVKAANADRPGKGARTDLNDTEK
jgi:predicted transcriptional regulator of viral defense system